MASLIPGFEYDIFISYRQKDNKGDRWVSRFVEALKTELEATFKEDVSVYFDENPHDRLQETHNVNKSLEAKLRCLIFIPVLSQTYCDPSSYAWQYELHAFYNSARGDLFGMDIRLRNGNFSSRILPVRIHDLEQEDIELFEKETGAVLRSLDFVFTTAFGVNRPLKADEDHPNDNLSKTYFSDQINKLARAVKDIINGMQSGRGTVSDNNIRKEIPVQEEMGERRKKMRYLPPSGSAQKLILITSAFLVILIVASILALPGLFRKDELYELRSPDGKISVLVMPFQNNTSDDSKDFWQKMVQDNIITSLSNSDMIKVRQSESVTAFLHSKSITDYASLTSSTARNISQKLDARLFILGSINQSGKMVRLNARLIDNMTEEVLRSFQKEGFEDGILSVIDSLSMQIQDFLILSSLKQDEGPAGHNYESTSSPKAYEYYISGNEAFAKSDFKSAKNLFTEALRCDSGFTLASVWLAVTYLNLDMFAEGKQCITGAYLKRNQMPGYMRSKIEDVYAWYTIGPQGRIKYLKQLIEIDDQDPSGYISLGNSYFLIYQYDMAIPEFEKALGIYKKWNSVPSGFAVYSRLGASYHNTGQYVKEMKLYKEAEQIFPDHPALARRKAILAFSENDTVEAKRLTLRYISLSRENQASESTIMSNLAALYSEAGLLQEAEKYYRIAVSLRPGDMLKMNDLALFLIDKELNVDEGLELADRALDSAPGNYYFLQSKGWGLFRQGKYEEALAVLQKSWDLRSQNAIYHHQAFLQLEEARKAVAGRK